MIINFYFLIIINYKDEDPALEGFISATRKAPAKESNIGYYTSTSQPAYFIKLICELL